MWRCGDDWWRRRFGDSTSPPSPSPARVSWPWSAWEWSGLQVLSPRLGTVGPRPREISRPNQAVTTNYQDGTLATAQSRDFPTQSSPSSSYSSLLEDNIGLFRFISREKTWPLAPVKIGGEGGREGGMVDNDCLHGQLRNDLIWHSRRLSARATVPPYHRTRSLLFNYRGLGTMGAEVCHCDSHVSYFHCTEYQYHKLQI